MPARKHKLTSDANFVGKRVGEFGDKSTAAWAYYIEKLCPEGGLVVDPICSRIDVLKAACLTGRRGIGFNAPNARRLAPLIRESKELIRTYLASRTPPPSPQVILPS